MTRRRWTLFALVQLLGLLAGVFSDFGRFGRELRAASLIALFPGDFLADFLLPLHPWNPYVLEAAAILVLNALVWTLAARASTRRPS